MARACHRLAEFWGLCTRTPSVRSFTSQLRQPCALHTVRRGLHHSCVSPLSGDPPDSFLGENTVTPPNSGVRESNEAGIDPIEVYNPDVMLDEVTRKLLDMHDTEHDPRDLLEDRDGIRDTAGVRDLRDGIRDTSGVSSVLSELEKLPIMLVRCSFNNTYVNVQDHTGRLLTWISAGSEGYKGARKGTTFAAQAVGLAAATKARELGFQKVRVKLKGPGLGRQYSLKGFEQGGLEIALIQDVTPVPHNGCKPRKKRRV